MAKTKIYSFGTVACFIIVCFALLVAGGGITNSALGAAPPTTKSEATTGPPVRQVSGKVPLTGGSSREVAAVRPVVISNDTTPTLKASVAVSNSWQLQATLPGAIVHDIAFPTDQVGYAAAEAGQVWKTTDGGATWTEILNLGFPYYWYGVYTFDANHLFISGFIDPASNGNQEGILRESTDGGTTWGPDIVLTTNGWLYRVRFIDAMHGLVHQALNLSGPEAFHYTTNGGHTAGDWTSVIPDPSGPFFGEEFSFLPNLKARISGSSECTSPDGGMTWNCGPSVDPVFDGAIFFSNDDQAGWVGGGEISPQVKGWVHRTTDGGATWSGRVLNSPWPVRELYFVTDQNGWAAGGNIYSGNGGLYYTGDGGQSWSDDLNSGAEMSACDSKGSGFDQQVWCAGSLSNPFRTVVYKLSGVNTPTPTVTGTPPTNTPTITPTPIPCDNTTYQVVTTTATMIPAANDTGNHCDDCTSNIVMPFPVTVYGTPYTSVNAGSNGDLQFASNNAGITPYFPDNCLPVVADPPFLSTLFTYYDDLLTEITGTNGCPTCGIFTDTVGSAPNRQFIVRWDATYYSRPGEANFEVVLNENSPNMSVIYGPNSDSTHAAFGIQLNNTSYTSYACQPPSIPDGLRVDYNAISCVELSATPTTTVPPTGTALITSTSTAIATGTGTSISTAIATNTGTPVGTETPTICAISFSDVPTDNTFYANIECLACKGIISGYDDGTFRPNNQVTRGQIAKIVSNSADIQDDPGQQIYTDVPPSNPFYDYINRLTARGYMGGYTCNQIPQEPCDAQNRPYFRPGAQATRGQISKIISNAAGIQDDPGAQIYTDVPAGNPFYDYINRLSHRNVMGGYACGTIPQEPCDSENRPYFRWGNNTTRGQAAKIDANTFFPNCLTTIRQGSLRSNP